MLHQRVGLLDALEVERDLGLAFLGPFALAIVENAIFGSDHFGHEMGQLGGRGGDFLQAGRLDPIECGCTDDCVSNDASDDPVAGIIEVQAVGGQRFFGGQISLLARNQEIDVKSLPGSGRLAEDLRIGCDVGIAGRGIRPWVSGFHSGGRQDHDSGSRVQSFQLSEQDLPLRTKLRKAFGSGKRFIHSITDHHDLSGPQCQ